MSRRRGVQIAGTFAIFQAVMPMTGWVCVHTIVELFSSFEKFIPWKMCIRDRFNAECEGDEVEIGFNNRYLLDALRNARTEKVRMEISGPDVYKRQGPDHPLRRR